LDSKNTLPKCDINFITTVGLATKARACEGAGQKGGPGVTFHAPGSARKCEGMNPHTPK